MKLVKFSIEIESDTWFEQSSNEMRKREILVVKFVFLLRTKSWRLAAPKNRRVAHWKWRIDIEVGEQVFSIEQNADSRPPKISFFVFFVNFHQSLSFWRRKQMSISFVFFSIDLLGSVDQFRSVIDAIAVSNSNGPEETFLHFGDFTHLFEENLRSVRSKNDDENFAFVKEN